ncbi:GNAT family N-acetyltransferase [Bacteroides fragilis]|nr:GNAT family N-acetyltransferase [Bacteroides fragilis]
MGIIIHSLESVSFKDLYAAFSSAFKDYDFSLNADELRRMLDRRGYNPQLSFGAFFEGRLISFVFNGTGMYNNILTAYDTGTGTVPSFRGLHLTQKIFTFSLELIYQQGVRQYVLEVLQHNHKAIKIYRKLGFETQRNFNYYSAKLSDIVPVLQVNHTACRILPSDLKNCLNQTAWFDFHPSWQNDRASLERGIDNLDILGAYEREELVGFVIFEPASGDISSSQLQKITGVKE